MNDNPIISLPVSADLSAYSHVAVKLTSTGIALASGVNDIVIGTMIRGNSAAANVGDTVIGRAAAVKLASGNGLHFVTLGAGVTTAIAMGDELQLDATDGTYSYRTTGAAAAIAVDSAPSSNDGAVIRAILLPPRAAKENTQTLTAATTLTAADSGTTIFLNSATEFAVTLPALAAGLRFKFIVKAAPSGASYTVTNASGTTIVGQITTNDFSGTTDSDFEASGAATITFVDAKAVKGDWVEVICDGTNWYATGACSVFDAITIS